MPIISWTGVKLIIRLWKMTVIAHSRDAGQKWQKKKWKKPQPLCVGHGGNKTIGYMMVSRNSMWCNIITLMQHSSVLSRAGGKQRERERESLAQHTSLFIFKTF